MQPVTAVPIARDHRLDDRARCDAAGPAPGDRDAVARTPRAGAADPALRDAVGLTARRGAVPDHLSYAVGA